MHFSRPSPAAHTLGVKVRNMKMNFNTGVTWRCAMISYGNFCPVAVFNGAEITLLKNDPTFFRKIFKKNSEIFFRIFFMIPNGREGHGDHIDTQGDHIYIIFHENLALNLDIL